MHIFTYSNLTATSTTMSGKLKFITAIFGVGGIGAYTAMSQPPAPRKVQPVEEAVCTIDCIIIIT